MLTRIRRFFWPLLDRTLCVADRIYLWFYMRRPEWEMAVISPDEEVWLGERAQAGDSGAREQLCQRNRRFSLHVARSTYRPGGPSLRMLIQAADRGLDRAARSFDPAFNTRFVFYASYWVRHEIQRAITEVAPR